MISMTSSTPPSRTARGLSLLLQVREPERPRSSHVAWHGSSPKNAPSRKRFWHSPLRSALPRRCKGALIDWSRTAMPQRLSKRFTHGVTNSCEPMHTGWAYLVSYGCWDALRWCSYFVSTSLNLALSASCRLGIQRASSATSPATSRAPKTRRLAPTRFKSSQHSFKPVQSRHAVPHRQRLTLNYSAA